MKKQIYLIAILMLLISCSQDNDLGEVNTITEEEQMEIEETATLQGDFVSAAHPTTGKAIVSDNKSTVSFLDFKTDNGPKLLVYLSKDLNASSFKNLGDLKGVEGNFSYAIPSNTDLSEFKYVMIWCVDFSVNFGHAELK